MTLKEDIRQGELVLKQVEDTLKSLSEIDSLIETPAETQSETTRAIKLLLGIQIIDFESRKKSIIIKLAKKRKEYTLFFEKQSIEANANINTCVSTAKTYVGREPRQITDLIQPIIDHYTKNVADLTQEERNTIYYKLKGHINFMKNTYKG